MRAWFDDPRQLIRRDQISEFWPTSDQSPEDRINAASRFVLYASSIVFLIRRDPRVYVLGLTVLAVIFVLYKMKMVKVNLNRVSKYEMNSCQAPTKNNPMGNVLMTDYADSPNRLEACYYSHPNEHVTSGVPFDSGRSRSPLPKFQRNAIERQFVTNPVTQIPGDQTQFAEWLYGPKNGPMCKSDSKYCNPDARGVQLEAFSGLGGDGDIRGQRGGGRVRSGGGTYS
jgi:Ca2+/Na+ antiporter|tara:strand:+ start:3425 stop:4105 length:681 start_codon:yes stop_codon:yes gene_type:complete